MTSSTYTNVEREVLRRITPSQVLPAIVSKTLQKLQAQIDHDQVLASVVLGGSTAKGTYLAGDHDIDVFVRFDRQYDSSKISGLLGALLQKCFKDVTLVHGSRDYFHLLEGKFTFEFVPVLRVDSWEEAENVTDMSPLHVAYVREKILAKPSLSDDIRLTKQFCKAAKVYGAESYIGGFSGHVIDLLIIYYGGFHALLRAASQWSARVVIDPERRLDDPLTQMQEVKLQSPLVIVDPVQHDRNSAAAVTAPALARFRQKAAAYLCASQSDQKTFFHIVPLDPGDIAQAYPDSRIIVVILSPVPGKRDVSGAKCAKVYEFLLRESIESGFYPLESQWEFSQTGALLVFVFAKDLLSDLVEHVGPPVHRTDDVRRFSDAHETVLSRDGRAVAIEKRAFRDPLKFIKFCCTKSYVLERVKSAKVKEWKSVRHRTKK